MFLRIAGCVLALAMVSPLTMTREQVMKHPANARLSKALVRYGPSVKPHVVKPSVLPAKPLVVVKDVPNRFINSAYSDIYRSVEKEARRAKISPVVMFAIMWHETGAFRSRLWRDEYNPGGIKYSPRRSAYRSGAYCSFESPADGIRAEADVLLHRRYNGARDTKNVYEQVAAISNGGYAEYSSSWESKVNRLVSRFSGTSVVREMRVASRRKIRRHHRHYCHECEYAD